jgi:hypothetical protein
MGTYEVGYWGHPHTLLPGDADHCPGQAVGALCVEAQCSASGLYGSHRGLPLVPAL